MYKLSKTNRTVYLASLFLYNFARVLPHAILTVILLNKGLTVSQIAIVQSFYMLAAIMFEFPSGFLTDIWSEKIMYQLSLVLIGISYFIILFTNNYYLLCLSWFIYGMSAASMSGSLDSYFIRRAENKHEIKGINVLINRSTLYSGLIGGGLGSFLYEILSEQIYILSLLLIISSFILITFGFHAENSEENNEMTSSESFNQIIAIFSNALFSRHNFSNSLIPLTITLSGALLISIFTPDKILFLIFIIIFLVPFNVYNNQLIVNIQKESDSNIVASVISLAGTVSSIISMIVLWIIGILNNYFEFWFVEVVLIGIFIILSLFLLILYSHQKKLD